jgi:hypothetical protein
MQSFRIEVKGQTYQGTWILRGQDRVEVRSDYGSRQANLDGRDAAAVARDVLRNLITPLYRS